MLGSRPTTARRISLSLLSLKRSTVSTTSLRQCVSGRRAAAQSGTALTSTGCRRHCLLLRSNPPIASQQELSAVAEQLSQRQKAAVDALRGGQGSRAGVPAQKTACLHLRRRQAPARSSGSLHSRWLPTGGTKHAAADKQAADAR
jgi:hypothetical protein